MKKDSLLGILIAGALAIAALFGVSKSLQNTQDFEAGTTIPKVVALFEDSLQNKISSSATSITLVRGTDKQGNSLSGTYGFIIDEGTSVEEFIICSASGTALTSCLRGIDVDDGETEVAALQFEHRRGASIKVTSFPQMAILSRVLNGSEGIPNVLYYDSQPNIAGSTSTALVPKFYADNLVNQGAASSTESVAGILELATQIESASSTQWSADNEHAQNSEHATSTPNPTAYPGLWDVWSENDGKLSQNWYDFTEGWTFTGGASTTRLVIGTQQPTGNSSTTAGLWVGGNATTTGTLDAFSIAYGGRYEMFVPPFWNAYASSSHLILTATRYYVHSVTLPALGVFDQIRVRTNINQNGTGTNCPVAVDGTGGYVIRFDGVTTTVDRQIATSGRVNYISDVWLQNTGKVSENILTHTTSSPREFNTPLYDVHQMNATTSVDTSDGVVVDFSVVAPSATCYVYRNSFFVDVIRNGYHP